MQSIDCRCNCESNESWNKGNIKELFNLMTEEDLQLRKEWPQYGYYFSHEYQIGLIEVLSTSIAKNILIQMNDAFFLKWNKKKTKDISESEQLANQGIVY